MSTNYKPTMHLIVLLLVIATSVRCCLGAESGSPENVARLPNILFAISDDQSFPHASAYGCEWVDTPSFDRVAREGLLFRNCYTPNAKCAPSRSCIVTGRNSWQLEAAGNHVCHFPEKFKSYCEVLAEQTEYVVGFTGKGVDPVRAPGRRLTGRSWDGQVSRPPTKAISGKDYAANFERFLVEKPAGRPFCFWYGAHEPHRSYQYRSGIELGGRSVTQIPVVPRYWPDNETVRSDMLDYAFEIEHFDSHLGRMLELLEKRGELDHTLIIVTSDNGMPFPRAKGTEYEASNHLPLAIMWPTGINKPGREITDYVSFIDFAPTILELAGIADPESVGMQSMQGRSLTPIFSSEKTGRAVPERDHVLLGQERHDVGRPDDVGYPIRSIICEGMLYIYNFEVDRWPMCDPLTGYLNTDGSPTKTEVLEARRRGDENEHWQLCFGKRGREELYDIRKDPDCMTNLIGDRAFESLAVRLKDKLFGELQAQSDPRMHGKGHVFDEYPYARDEHIDFYNRYRRGEVQGHITGWVLPGDFETESLESE